MFINEPEDIVIIISHLIAYSLFFFIFEFLRKKGKKIYKKEVLGKGDSYLSGSIGLLIGIKYGFISLAISFLCAAFIESIIMVFLKKNHSKRYFPLGPYLCFGLIVVWIVGGANLWSIWENYIIRIIS